MPAFYYREVPRELEERGRGGSTGERRDGGEERGGFGAFSAPAPVGPSLKCDPKGTSNWLPRHMEQELNI